MDTAGAMGRSEEPGGGDGRSRATTLARSVVLRAAATDDGRAEAVLATPAPHSDPDLQEIASALGELAVAPDAPFGPHEGDLGAAELSGILADIAALRSALGAIEIRVGDALDECLRAQDVQQGVPERDRGRRTASEIRMASRISPGRASGRLRSGRRLVHDMPQVFGALAQGRLTEAAAHAIGRSSGPLDVDQRREMDSIIVSRIPDLDGASSTRWGQEVTALVQQIDPGNSQRRHVVAARERSVTVTPGAHGMGDVHAHLSALDCAAIRRKLSLEAEAQVVAGDPRTHQQIMADLFADTLLGREEGMDPVHLDVGLVLTERTLFAPEHGDPAMIEGYGTVPPGVAREAITERLPRHRSRKATSEAAASDEPDTVFDEQSRLVLRRLFTHPTSGELVAAESRARAFPRGLARMISLRDATCAGPYCSAGIRQIDHIRPHSRGGATTFDDGQGLCAYCNGTKELLGTAERVGETSEPHLVHWTSRLGRTARLAPAPIVGLPMDSRPSVGKAPPGPPPLPAPPRENRPRIRIIDPDELPPIQDAPDPLGEDCFPPPDSDVFLEERLGLIPLSHLPTAADLDDLCPCSREDIPCARCAREAAQHCGA
ncbi:HNH endonuclease signature motif containing protein [Brachybacterium endophyticum]|nr:HNH endonuclease signature motif containing protein [Brachybacterium endophyticum]